MKKFSSEDFDFTKLKSSLINSGFQRENNSLYQTITSLIDGIQFLKESISDKIGKKDKIDLDTQVDGYLGVKNGGSYSDVYLPVLTLVANLSGAGVDDLNFYENGTVVTVSGRVQVTPTIINTDTKLGISLPILSYFKFDYQCGGAAGSPTVNQSGAIIGDTINKRAELRFKSADIITYDMFFTFAYRIIEQ